MDYLAQIEQVALGEANQLQARFKEWASEYCQVWGGGALNRYSFTFSHRYPFYKIVISVFILE